MKQTAFTQSRWSLSELFSGPQSSELEETFTRLEELVTAFEALRPQLSEEIPAEDFLSAIRQLEEINLQANRIYSYANLWFSEDTQNQDAQTLVGRVEQFAAGISNRVLFFSLWWKDLPDAAAARLMAGAGDYRYWLEEMRHFKPYTLSEPEEKVINLKNVTGSNALTLLYDSITNRYTFKLKVEGKKLDLTRGELMVYARHHDPSLRAQAYQELYRVYENDASILGQIYQTLVRDWQNEQIGLRGFKNAITARNLANDIPDEVVDILLEICQRNSSIFQRYFNLKARWLGIERLRRYDIYAPVARAEKQYEYGRAAEMVLASFEEFDPQLAGLARQVFSQQHIDSQVRKGKRSGAFCLSPAPNLTPWVMLNYQGKAEDVATMAHELGHAIHSQLAAGHSIFTYHACLPLAETASTFGEMMLIDRLLKEESDEAVRRDLLFRQVDDAYATILRQAFFALFERQAHEMIGNNASINDLSGAYLENLRLQFGDAVELSEEFRWEWVSIPHIYHVPFYVYAYAFGQLLVLSLYQQYQLEGAAFKPRYLKILSTGGAEPPVGILADAGVDVRQPGFWQGGFDVIASLIGQLEALPVKS